MGGLHPQIDPALGKHLAAHEQVLWHQLGGRIPSNTKIWYWISIPLVCGWIFLAVRMSLDTWEPPSVPFYIKPGVAILSGAWGLLLLWAVRRNLPKDKNLVFAVTDRRVLVVNTRRPEELMQASIEELGNIEVEDSQDVGRLRINRKGLISLNPIFAPQAEWYGVSNPQHVKSLIEQRKSLSAREKTQ